MSTYGGFFLLLRAGLRAISIIFALLLFLSLPTSAQAWAQTNSLTAGHPRCPSFSGEARRALRGAWIATVANIDWPSRPGLPVAVQKQEFRHLLDQAVSLGLNAVFVQVRPAADAFYPSHYAPWSAYLSGVQGGDPGYDPLAFMIAEAHRRNLEFYAWFNPYRVSLHENLTALAPTSPARQHPDWVVRYGGRLYFNPGLPAVRRLLVDSIMEVVQRYAIDGVHLDDYFYPYPVRGKDFPDRATYLRYRAGRDQSLADWRRANINALISTLMQKIHGARRSLKFGVSPFGVWRNRTSDARGSATSAAVDDYDSLYADVRTWIRHNWLDYVAPQLYWPIGFPAANYAVLVPWWAQVVTGTRVHLYIGQAAYKIGGAGPWSDPAEMLRHLELNRRYPAVRGDIYFSLKDLLRNPLGFGTRLRRELYRHPALIPLMPWLGGAVPATPSLISAAPLGRGSGVRLLWQDGLAARAPGYYAIYRLNGGPAHSLCALENPRALLATVVHTRGTLQTFVDRTALPGQTYTYYVSALDRLHHESHLSRARTITLAPAGSGSAQRGRFVNTRLARPLHHQRRELSVTDRASWLSLQR
jgi:uncharacterized lipoprotein YddW (UPF0748 family)